MRASNNLVLAAAMVFLAGTAFAAYAPPTTNVLFSVNRINLGANRSNVNSWGIFTSTGATGYVPKVETVRNVTTGVSVKWLKPAASSLDSKGVTTAGGSGMTSGIISPSIKNSGFTLVTAIQPTLNSFNSSELRSIVNIYAGALSLLVSDSGVLSIKLQDRTRVGVYKSYSSTKKLANNQPVVLSMTINSSGVFNVWADGVNFLSGQNTSWPTTYLMPNKSPIGSSIESKNSIGLGSAGGIVTGTNSSTFRGYIGDTYCYTNLFTNSARLDLIDYVKQDMGMTPPPPSSVPEPATALSSIILLFPAGIFFRPRRRK